MAGGGGGGDEPEFQVAPMIDVLLTILIFFMTITSAQVLKTDRTIKLPAAPDAQKKDNMRSEAIVNVRWNPASKKAVFVYDDVEHQHGSDLEPLLKKAREVASRKIAQGQNPNFRVVIRGDQDLPALYISQAMNAAGEAGISDISFSAASKD